MRARAPGKVVLSGAYVVLEGAPALVSAVSRYAIADTARAAEWFSPEVLAALPRHKVPFCDTSDLRTGDRKLGLGSSAAALVASLAAAVGSPKEPLDTLRERLFPLALRAHRQAQGGGSGIDIAASVWGGTLSAKIAGDSLAVRPIGWPKALSIEVWASGTSASTPELLRAVARLRDVTPRLHQNLMAKLGTHAHTAVRAVENADSQSLIAALRGQVVGLDQLGSAAGVAIVVESARPLNRLAESQGAVFMPSGAGGGDVSLWIGLGTSGPAFAEAARAAGWELVEIAVGASGVECLPVPEG